MSIQGNITIWWTVMPYEMMKLPRCDILSSYLRIMWLYLMFVWPVPVENYNALNNNK